MILHSVNKSPFAQQVLASCLGVASPGDGVILIEDGVYGALTASPLAATMRQLAAAGVSFYALLPDLDARGLGAEAMQSIVAPVSDAEFVALAVRAGKVQSWY